MYRLAALALCRTVEYLLAGVGLGLIATGIGQLLFA